MPRYQDLTDAQKRKIDMIARHKGVSKNQAFNDIQRKALQRLAHNQATKN